MNPDISHPENTDMVRKVYHNNGRPIVSRLSRALPLVPRRERRKLLRQIQKENPQHTPQPAPVAASAPIASPTDQIPEQIST